MVWLGPGVFAGHSFSNDALVYSFVVAVKIDRGLMVAQGGSAPCLFMHCGAQQAQEVYHRPPKGR